MNSAAGWVSPRHALMAVLLVSAAVRFQGLGWGSDPETGVFHGFHPDETTMVESAGLIGVNMREITAPYQKMPMYVLAGAVRAAGLVTGVEPFVAGDNRSWRMGHVVGRGISALLGTLTVLVVFWIGRELAGEWTGVLGAALLGLCASHIQQCHYYTVDASLTFWICLSVAAFIRMPSERSAPYLVGGLAWGMAGGTRLMAMVLGLPFIIAHLMPHPGKGLWLRRVAWRRLLGAKPVLCGVAAALLALAGEPFLLMDRELLFGDDDLRRFAMAMEVAEGEIVRIWTLYDFGTTPYLFYVTHLFRYAMGTPLEIASLAGLVLAARSRHQGWAPVLVWLGVYFLMVGRLHTKPIRYTTPMLPFFSVTAAMACLWAGRRVLERFPDRIRPAFAFALPIALVGVPVSVYGLAMAGIYQQEDARLEAVRWIRSHIPEGARVMTERGGFSTSWMVPEDRYSPQVDQATFFILSQGRFLFNDQVQFVQQKLTDTDWVVIIEENRLRQFLQAREVYPVGWDYYRRLADGSLGYDRSVTFKVSPWAGWTFDEAEAEPTVTAFDHPSVSVYRRGDRDVNAILERWRQETAADPLAPDPYVKEGIAAFRNNDLDGAERSFRKSMEVRPDFLLGHLLMFEVYKRRQDRAEAARALESAKGGEGLTPEILVGLVKSGMQREGIEYMSKYARSLTGDDPRDAFHRLFVAQTWFDLGVASFGTGDYKQAAADFQKVTEFAPDFAATYINLGKTSMEMEDYAQAVAWLEKAAALDPGQAEPHLMLAKVAHRQKRYDPALDHIRKAMDLDPNSREVQRELLEQGISRYEADDLPEAVAIFDECLKRYPDAPEAMHNLGLVRMRQNRQREALGLFRRAHRSSPEEPTIAFSLARSFEEMGNPDSAIAVYRKVLSLRPDHSAARARLEVLTKGEPAGRSAP